MEIERRERDPDTGEIVGEGFSDVFAKIAAKLTGKTAKKLATKAAEKLVEKGAEKIGEKTGQLVGEKIYDKFSAKRPTKASEESERAEFPSEALQSVETKGKEIGKMLAAASKQASLSPAEKNKFLKINNVYADLL